MLLAKVCLLGDGGVGKTALRDRYMGKNFSSNYIMTIGADFSVKKVEGSWEIKFQIWDLAGQPRFSVVRSLYYKGTSGALLVFDLTRPDSFHNIGNWAKEAWSQAGSGIVPVVLLGNKSDLRQDVPDAITDEQGHELAKKLSETTESQIGHTVKFMTTSAKTGENVDFAFLELAKAIHETSKGRKPGYGAFGF